MPATTIGTITLDGTLSDWTSAKRLDSFGGATGYEIYGQVTGGYYVFAIQAPVAIATNTTTIVYLNTDENPATGYNLFSQPTGSDYFVTFDTTGLLSLYTGDPTTGGVFVASLPDVAPSPDGKIIEFAIPATLIGTPPAIQATFDISGTTYLPSPVSVTQYEIKAPAPAPVFGPITIDGTFTDWTPSDRLESGANTVAGYDIFGKLVAGTYVIGLESTSSTNPVIGAGTTIWLNTDQNAATGFSPFGSVGAEYNVTFAADGKPYLYANGAAGQTLVSGAPLDYAFSPGGTGLEIAIPGSLLTPAGGTAPHSINFVANIDNLGNGYLPGDLSQPQYIITDPSTVPPPAVFGTKTIDGSFTDWTQSDRLEHPANLVPGYEILGSLAADTYLIGLESTSSTNPAIGPGTTIWLNTDQNAATGFSPFGSVGAEYNVTFAADGMPYLYTGAAGQTLVNSTPLDYAFSPDRHSLEIAVPRNLLTPAGGTAPHSINLVANINNLGNGYLPGDLSLPQYTITDPSTVLTKTPTHKVAIVWSDTSANLYFPSVGETTPNEAGTLVPLPGAKTAYSDLFMAAQHQAEMAGVSYDIITESDLTNINTLTKYDALIFPAMADVNAAQLPAIAATLTSAVYDYHIPIITAGDFLTNDQTGAALSGNSYTQMQNLLGLTLGSAGQAVFTVTANDVTNPAMKGYAAGELIGSYNAIPVTNAVPGYSSYNAVANTPVDVLANLNVNGSATPLPGVVQTTTGGTNVHFATTGLLGDSNLLSNVIQSVVLGTQPGVALHMTRQAGIVASRTDMDQSQFPSDVSPTDASSQPVPGIYDKLIPILEQWKQQYNFVGSYYINLGDGASATDPASTNWAKSLPYYQAILATGSEIGNHSYTHLVNPPTGTAAENTNFLSTATGGTGINQFTFDYEFGQSKAIEAANLGIPIAGAAVPGAAETLATAEHILPYYQSSGGLTGYVTGGWTGVGAGYPNAFGYMTPTDQGSVYIAPNMTFDFTELQFKKQADGVSFQTAAQALADWTQQFNTIASHAAVPVVVWPWHDYGAAVWDTDPTTHYSTDLFTAFIAQASAANFEFVTLEDLASRIEAQQKASINYTTAGNTITATVTPDPTAPDVGEMALDVINGGSNVIKSIATSTAGWYAYDAQQLFLPRNGGIFVVNLGTAQDDVTHIDRLPSRADLLSLTGDGTNLNFSIVGDGTVGVHLQNPAAHITSIQESSPGTPTASMTANTNNELNLTFADTLIAPLFSPLQHDVKIQQGTAAVLTTGNDIVVGTTGNDILPGGGGGNDTLIGNGGTDTVLFTGSMSDYTISIANGIETVVSKAAGWIDTLIGITNVLFGPPPPPVLALAVDSGTSNVDNITNSGLVNVSGLVQGATWKYSLDNGTTWIPGTAPVNGVASLTVSGDGTHTVLAEQTNVAGGISAPSLPLLFTLDTVAPLVSAGLATDTGSSPSDGVTSIGTLTGSGDPTAAVNLTIDGQTILGATTADGTGTWTFTPTNLSQGSHTVIASETDLAGNTGDNSLSPFVFNFDTQAPTVTISNLGGPTSQAAQTITGTVDLADAGTTVTILDGTTPLNTATVDPQGNWQALVTLAGPGAHSITATDMDAAGNVGTSAPVLFTLDTALPTAPMLALAKDSGPIPTDGITNSGVVNVSNIETGATWQYSIDGGQNWITGNGSSLTLTADGTYSVVADQTNTVGTSVPSAALAFTLDTHGPTGWQFTLPANFAFTGNSIAAGTALGAALATGDPNSSSFEYFFASDAVGDNPTQSLNGLAINATTGAITAAAALSGSSSTWLIAEDVAGNLFAKQLVLAVGTSGADTIAGATGNDVILAGAGNDTITGFVGADMVDGGAGTDRILLTATSPVLSPASDAQIAHVETITAAGTTTPVTIDLHSQTEGFTITGGSGADTIIGGAGPNTINGGAGNDTITGGAGADIINGGTGNDTIIGFVGADTVNGGGGTDTIVLNATSLELNAASDLQIAGVAAISAAGAPGPVTINLSHQTDGFTITGSSFAETITGSSGNDTIVGFVGVDTVDGGGGTDTIRLTATSNDLNTASDAQIANVETITATGTTTPVTIDLRSQTEGFTITGGSGADTIIGGAGPNTINGGAGNDTITGGAGADIINGGTGNDTIIGFVGADTVNGGGGTDTIVLNATSPELNAASDLQIAGVAAISAAGAPGPVTINLSHQTDGFTITGSSFAETITGSSGNDTIVGFVGVDTVDGGGGTDTIRLTATSNDLNTASDAQIVNVEAVSASTTTPVTIDLSHQTEGFTITGGSGNDTILGGAGANTITGGAGNDTITGGAGADIINGGAGNERIMGFVGADTINGGAATDMIALTATSNDLNNATNGQITNVEAVSAAGATAPVTIDLHLQTEGFTITASAYGDTITGDSGANTINGGAGNDTIMGFVGANTINGGGGTDTIVLDATSTALNNATNARITNVEAVSAAGATAGVTIDLHNQNDGFTVTGSNFADTITGSSGNDTITGGPGNDRLTGGGGADTFVFRTGFGAAVVTDFSIGNATTHDTLNLQGLGFLSVADVLTHTDTGANAVIHSGADTITLTGVTLAQLTSHLFDIVV